MKGKMRKKIKNGDKSMSTIITSGMLRWMSLFGVGSVLIAILSIWVSIDSWANDGSLTVFEKIKSYFSDGLNRRIIVLFFLFIVLLIILWCREKEEFELLGKLKKEYDKNSDYIHKPKNIVRLIKEYQPGVAELQSPKCKTAKENGYTLAEKIFALKTVLIRKTSESNQEIAVKIVSELGVSFVSAELIKVDNIFTEPWLYLFLLVLGVFIFLDTIDERKRNRFILKIVEELEKEELELSGK